MKRTLLKLWHALREWSGDDAYERYLREHAACPEHPPLSAREFYLLKQQGKWSGIQRCC